MFAPPVCAEATPDAVASASVTDFYGSAALTGDDLMNAINSLSGFYALATVNPDGTPNVGYYIYSCVKEGDKYYLQLGLAPNQTSANLAAGSKAVAMYAALPGADAQAAYAISGARMTLAPVEDAELIKRLVELGPQSTETFYEIVSVRPLG